LQNDFITGSLAVKDASSVIAPINDVLSTGHFGTVVFSRDSHPPGHISFASTHEGQMPFTTVHLPNPALSTDNPPSAEPSLVAQDLWPDHCVVGEHGWGFHPELHVHHADAIIDKGHARHRDSYSAFYKEEDYHSHTVLGKALADRGVEQVYVVGLALDYCVGSTAIDAALHGFEVS
jgi:nicotinamidase/pyrazinamidase